MLAYAASGRDEVREEDEMEVLESMSAACVSSY